MAKTDKKKKEREIDNDNENILSHIQKETWQGILSILFFVLTNFGRLLFVRFHVRQSFQQLFQPAPYPKPM